MVDYNSIGKNILRPKIRNLNETELFNTQMVLSSKRTQHTRRIYGWLDLLGDMGGVQGALCVCLEFLLLPISEHCYLLKAFLPRALRLLITFFPPGVLILALKP